MIFMENNKIKIIIIMFFISIMVLGTFALYTSSANLKIEDQKLAAFMFDAKKEDSLEIPLVDLKPGDSKDYNFSVTNRNDDIASDVVIGYEVIIKTYLYMPLDITLYKDNDEYVGECTNKSSRGEKNELICTMPIDELHFDDEGEINYKLNISFDEEYDDLIYSGLVDFINLEIKSWQKIK